MEVESLSAKPRLRLLLDHFSKITESAPNVSCRSRNEPVIAGGWGTGVRLGVCLEGGNQID